MHKYQLYHVHSSVCSKHYLLRNHVTCEITLWKGGEKEELGVGGWGNVVNKSYRQKNYPLERKIIGKKGFVWMMGKESTTRP